MAVNVTLSVSNSSMVGNQNGNGVVNVACTGSTGPLTVNSIQLQNTNGASIGNVIPNGPNAQNGVAQNSSTNFPFAFALNCDLQPVTPQFAFPITAYVYTSDGSVTASQVVTPLATPPQTQAATPGLFPFTPPVGGGPLANTPAVTPSAVGQFPNPPVNGQTRMDANFDSGVFVTVVSM